MKRKVIYLLKRCLVAMIAAVGLLASEPGISALAANEIVTGVTVPVDSEVVSDGTDEDVIWEEPAADWYKDYKYTLEGDKIYLNDAADDADFSGRNVVVPATAVIDGKTYGVVIDYAAKYMNDFSELGIPNLFGSGYVGLWGINTSGGKNMRRSYIKKNRLPICVLL